MRSQINYSGLIIAIIGFLVTRSTVTLAIYEEPVHFYLAGVLPLALGLGLAAFGVALTVADIEAGVVRTTALWCVIGTGAMLLLAVLSLLGTPADDVTATAPTRSQSLLSNFLIGGSIGGTLTGLYASRTQRQRRELQRRTNRLIVLNRLLRHEVLNAVTAIRGYVSLPRDEHPEASDIIEARAIDIERTIGEVKHLTNKPEQGGKPGGRVDLRECLKESVETVQDRHPEATVSLESVPAGVMVRADDQLSRVFTHLLENAIVHAEDTTPTVRVSDSDAGVRVSVIDDGGGLPESQQSLLETGVIDTFDNPRTGFGLNIVRLLLEEYGGRVEIDVTNSGTTITVILPQAKPSNGAHRPSRVELASVRPATPHLVVSFGAALLAGVFYGLVSESLGGSVAGIGVFYGTSSVVVGWITHQFHSVVFGFIFVGLVALVPERYQRGIVTYIGIGTAWALTLWLGAAGFIAPIWLQLIGIPAQIPSFSGILLLSHLVWGLSLGALTALGYKHVIPWLTPVVDNLQQKQESIRPE